jgi:hypothetical protein
MKDVGFEVEIEFDGEIHTLKYGQAVRSKETVDVAVVSYDSKFQKFTLKPLIESSKASKKIWNLDTENFHPVTLLTHSPNFWDDNRVGNKHYFFMLKDCKNDGTARGFYNEFLISELNSCRKAMEMIGAQMRTDASMEQLSGLGFSVANRNHVIVRVTGATTRTIKINF